MREIKFRAWDNEMQSFSMNKNIRLCTEFNKDLVYVISGVAMAGIIFQQFTGLKDKNEKEIYEGDILKTNISAMEKCEVFFYDMHGAWYIRHDGLCYELTPYVKSYFLIEVIGNICENKELLQ